MIVVITVKIAKTTVMPWKKQWLITMLSSEETNTSILNVIKLYM